MQLRDLNKPYVSLQFRVANAEGEESGHCAELSLEQFRALRAALASAHASM